MLLHELFEGKMDGGTFVGAHLSAESVALLKSFIEDNKIPNHIKLHKLHCTMLYSRETVANIEVDKTYETPIKCTAQGIAIWKTKKDENGNTKNCLVLQLKSPMATKRHDHFMKKYPEATHDYPEFKVHVTLSYDAGDFDVKALPAFTDNIYLTGEFTNPASTGGFTTKNSTKSK